jgi:hypothetical protein
LTQRELPTRDQAYAISYIRFSTTTRRGSQWHSQIQNRSICAPSQRSTDRWCAGHNRGLRSRQPRLRLCAPSVPQGRCTHTSWATARTEFRIIYGKSRYRYHDLFPASHS